VQGEVSTTNSKGKNKKTPQKYTQIQWKKRGGGYGKPNVRGQTEGVREIEKRKRAKSSVQEENSAKSKSLCTATQRRQIA
jgi:hypothetical protein